MFRRAFPQECHPLPLQPPNRPPGHTPGVRPRVRHLRVTEFTDNEQQSIYLYGKLPLAKLKEPTGGEGLINLGDNALEFIGHQAGIPTNGSDTPAESSSEIESFTGEGAADPSKRR